MRRTQLVPVLLLTTISTLLAIPTLTYPLGRDQGVFATMGQGILEQRPPYAGLWDFKPPAVYYVYALFIKLFGTNLWAVRLIDLILMPFVALVLFWIARLIGNYKVGILCLAAFPVFYFRESFWTLSQSDGIVLLPMTLTVACLLKANRHSAKAWWWMGLAGCFSATVFWFKYPFALFIFALVVAHIMTGYKNPKTILTHGIAFAVGGLMAGLGSIAYFESIGIMDDLIDSAMLASEYSRQSYALSEFTDSPVWRQAVNDHWSNWQLLWIATLLWPFTWFFWRRGQKFIQSGWLYIWCWLVAGIAILIVQGKGYDYHWLPLIPPPYINFLRHSSAYN